MLRELSTGGTVASVDVTSAVSSTVALTNMRARNDATVSVLAKALDTAQTQAAELLGSLPVPAGLVYGPNGSQSGSAGTIDVRM